MILQARWQELATAGILEESDDFEAELTAIDLLLRSKPSRAEAETGELRAIAYEFRRGFLKALSTLFEQIEDRANHRYLERFAEHHVLAGDSIITFNYDLLAERSLYRINRWSPRTGYGLDLSEEYTDLKGQPESPTQILKLHGSIGWFSTFTPGRFVILGPHFSNFVGPQLGGMKNAGFGGHSPLVLPTYEKDFSAHPFPGLWTTAAEKLRSADSVFIIGYSIPAADSAASNLMLNAIRPGTRVVYFHTPAGRANTLRIGNMFSAAGITVEFEEASIEELAERLAL